MSMVQERSSKNNVDQNGLHCMGLQQCTTLNVQTHVDFVDQWRSDYPSQAFPTVLTHRVGGPEFFIREPEDPKRSRRNVPYQLPQLIQVQKKWRASYDKIMYPAIVTPFMFMRAMARRVEG